MKKTLFVLLGPKGAGKSYISRLMEKEWAIKFLRVEDIWLELEKENVSLEEKTSLGRKKIKQEIKKLFLTHNAISIESTGTSDNFEDFLGELQQRCEVCIIKVLAPTSLCLERIAQRNTQNHVAYNLEELLEKDAMARDLEFGSKIIVNNSEDGEKNILKALRKLFLNYSV